MKVRVVIPPLYAAPSTRVEDLRPGEVADDGSIYLCQYSGSDWFVTDSDARHEDGSPLALTFNEAAAYAKALTAHDKNDWALPSLPALHMMLHHHADGAFKDTYVDNDVNRPGYWTSLKCEGQARSIRFTDRMTAWTRADHKIFVRCVRSVPRKPMS